MFSHLPGSSLAKQMLARMIEKKAVPSTLLLHGSDMATAPLSEAFAHVLTNHSKLDIHVLKPEGKTQQHPIAAIRALIDEVALPPFKAPCKVFIVHDAEKMLPSSSNALLKTLEEPPSDTHFILLSSQPKALLPTIISRCTQIACLEAIQGAASSHSIRELIENLFQAASYPELVRLLGKIEESGEEESAQDQAALYFQEIGAFLRLHSPERLEKILPLISKGRTAIQQNMKLKTVLEYLFLQIGN